MSKDFLSSWFTNDLMSDPNNVGRLRVDSQQTSFEANEQFRFFDDCSDQTEYGGSDESILHDDVLVYEFTSTYPVNIQTRIINGWGGGRKYLVFPNDGTETITGGTWADVSDQVYNVNGNLKDSKLSEHPASGVTIRKRLASSFVSTFKPRTGTAYLADQGSSNKSTGSIYSPESNRAGVAENQSFFLVFFNINGTAKSEFLFTVAWEEKFA